MVSEIELLHCTDEQRAMFSYEFAKRIGVYSGICEEALYWVNCTTVVT
jgi:hypothetical protein